MKKLFAEVRGRVRGWANFWHYPAIALPVCCCSCTQLRKHQQQEVDSSHFIIKRGFLWGIYKKRGL